jgi:glycosyltransferase involved in cell wall biosynthesis
MPPATSSTTHLVLIPSYDTGPKLFETVAAARAQWEPVWVVIDGSTDGTGVELERRAAGAEGMRIFTLAHNQGKGAAVLHGLRKAAAQGFTHALVMDSDGQHPADLIKAFMSASMSAPDAMILGRPVFGPEAPRERVLGRKISNFFAHLETLWAGIGDSLYGFRVYPIAALVDIMDSHRWMRRFDFDVEIAVRLVWRGVRPINIRAPVRYLTREEGGVSHFNYLRDNLLLIWMHTRLLIGAVLRLPLLIARRAQRLVRGA